MINHNLLQSSRYSTSSIAPELLTRLRTLQNHKGRLSKQTNTFSCVYPHPGYISRRWYSPIAHLPHPHIIKTTDHGRKMGLYALVSKAKTVVYLKMQSNVWWLERTIDENEVGAYLPAHASYASHRLLSQATNYQIHALSKTLLLPRSQMPKLSRYNASLLIQESLITHHLDEIMVLLQSATDQHAGLKKRTA